MRSIMRASFGQEDWKIPGVAIELSVGEDLGQICFLRSFQSRKIVSLGVTSRHCLQQRKSPSNSHLPERMNAVWTGVSRRVCESFGCH